MAHSRRLRHHQVELHHRNSASFRFYIQTSAAVLEGVTVTSLQRNHHHARPWTSAQHSRIGLFCCLMFTLAVYALPLFVAANAGI